MGKCLGRPIWPVQKSNGEWRLTVDYRGLNEVTPLLSAAILDMLELQYELESKAAKCQGEWPYLQPLAESTRGDSRSTPRVFESGIQRNPRPAILQLRKRYWQHMKGFRAASEVVGTEAQLLLARRLLVLGWMFKGRVPSTHHATDAMWNKWVALITQWARIGNPNRPGILEVMMDQREGKDFRISPEEVTRAKEAPLYNKLPENEKQYALFTDGSCCIVGKHWRWKAAVWSPL
ncbi:hypothetical protein QYF61_027311 [Mycteria americana]|uniref:Uncharacterized protein n=1 Tax=Mycteria americana TaxID=33587 RepID=A0AAN7RHG0_MYCAM|nr:hypothetical protein QYF61_027311 [Mycteria americana]